MYIVFDMRIWVLDEGIGLESFSCYLYFRNLLSFSCKDLKSFILLHSIIQNCFTHFLFDIKFLTVLFHIKFLKKRISDIPIKENYFVCILEISTLLNTRFSQRIYAKYEFLTLFPLYQIAILSFVALKASISSAE